MMGRREEAMDKMKITLCRLSTMMEKIEEVMMGRRRGASYTITHSSLCYKQGISRSSSLQSLTWVIDQNERNGSILQMWHL